MIFESPESTWDDAWKKGEVISRRSAVLLVREHPA
jgi:hypothetical protein